MMTNHARQNTLIEALEVVGSKTRLAKVLAVPLADLEQGMNGDQTIASEVYFAALQIVSDVPRSGGRAKAVRAVSLRSD